MVEHPILQLIHPKRSCLDLSDCLNATWASSKSGPHCIFSTCEKHCLNAPHSDCVVRVGSASETPCASNVLNLQNWARAKPHSVCHWCSLILFGMGPYCKTRSLYSFRSSVNTNWDIHISTDCCNYHPVCVLPLLSGQLKHLLCWHGWCLSQTASPQRVCYPGSALRTQITPDSGELVVGAGLFIWPSL